MVRLMIVDDHTLFREGLRCLFDSDEDFEVVAEAADGRECLEVLERIDLDVLLLDLEMPRMNGFEVLRYIKSKPHFHFKVLTLTIRDGIDSLSEAMDFGADGFLLKSCNFVELKNAIRSVLEGVHYIQPVLIPMSHSENTRIEGDKGKADSLTKRELEVLKSLSVGMSNREIASTFSISEQTVKNHVSNIFKKISVSDRTQAAVFAIRNRIVNLDS